MKLRISLRSMQGFTLAEVAITLFVIGIVMIIATPRLFSSLSPSPEAVSRRMTALVRSIREHSIMTHRSYRIAIDLDLQHYYVETLEEIDSDAMQFVIDTSVLHRTVALPSGVTIVDVMSPLNGTVKEGIAYISCFQNGLFPGAVVHLTDDNKQMYTLMLKPLTARPFFSVGYLYEDESENSG